MLVDRSTKRPLDSSFSFFSELREYVPSLSRTIPSLVRPRQIEHNLQTSYFYQDILQFVRILPSNPTESTSDLINVLDRTTSGFAKEKDLVVSEEEEEEGSKIEVEGSRSRKDEEAELDRLGETKVKL